MSKTSAERSKLTTLLLFERDIVDVERAEVDVSDVVIVELVNVLCVRSILFEELSSRFLQQKVFIIQRYGAVRL